MSKRMVVCFVLAPVAAFGTTACAGQESRLEERVEILEADRPRQKLPGTGEE